MDDIETTGSSDTQSNKTSGNLEKIELNHNLL